MKQITLASASPRRRELLEQIGLHVKVVPSKILEKLNPRLKPVGQAKALSLQKAEEVARKYTDAIIIGADTIVAINDEILGKPRDLREAKRMLRKLSGKTHTVITGFTIINTQKKKSITKAIETKVSMKSLSKKEINWYIKNEDLLDKAGAYAIQGKGSIFIEKIEGDYFNIVGLPLFSVAKELKKFSVLFYK